MRSKRKNKTLSILLTLAMVLTLIPLTAAPAYAATGTIDVGAVTGGSLAVNSSGTGWTWTAGTATLELTEDYTAEPVAIVCGGSDTIRIVYSGDVRIANGTGPGVACTGGSLIINGGGGTLVINSSDSDGIFMTTGDLTIESGAIEIYADQCGIIASVSGSVAVSGGDVEIDAGAGIAASGVTVSGGSLDIDATNMGIEVNLSNDVIIDGGSVNILAREKEGILADDGDVIIDGGEVGITTYDMSGISTWGSVTLDSGSLRVTSPTDGIWASGGVAIGGGVVNINTGNIGISTFSDVSIDGGKGIIKTSSSSADDWAVLCTGDITVGVGVTVCGWDGAGYTIPAIVGTAVSGGDDYNTFLDGDTDAALKDISFGDGMASGSMMIGGWEVSDLAADDSGTGWSWDAGSATLTLGSSFNSNLIEIECDRIDTVYLVYSGNVGMAGSSNPLVRCNGNLVISGSGGALTVAATGGVAISAAADLTICGNADVRATATSTVISGENVTIKDNASVTATSISLTNGNGIGTAMDGSITIDTTGTVAATGKGVSSTVGYALTFINGAGNIYIKSGTVKLYADDAGHMYRGTMNKTGGNLYFNDVLQGGGVPVITINTQPPVTTPVTYGSIAGSLSVAATATLGAGLSYQWYSNTANSNAGGTALNTTTYPTAATSSFTIPTALAAGTYYYFCEVRATGAVSKRSDVAVVTVAKAAQPTLTITSPGSKTYGDAAFKLATTGGVGAGAVTFALNGAGPHAGTVTGDGWVTITGAGSIAVRATKAGDANYNNATADITITVGKGVYAGTKTASKNVLSDTTGSAITVTLPALPTGAAYAAGGTVGGDTPALVASHSIAGTTLTFGFTEQTDGKSATITIPVTGALNYDDYDVVVTITAQDTVQESVPTASIDYTAEKLTGLVAGAEYKVMYIGNMGGTPVPFESLETADGGGNIPIKPEWLGVGAFIVKNGVEADGTADSDSQLLMIPERNSAPAVVGKTDTSDGNNNGTITGVDGTMEYRLGDTGVWTAIDGSVVTGRAAGTYNVRYKATAGDFASKSASVTIASSKASGGTGGGGGGGASGASLSKTKVAYDPASGAGVTVTLDSKGNTLKAVKNGGVTLKEGVDYTVSGNNVTLTPAYLASLGKGQHVIIFEMNSGNSPKLTITIENGETPLAGSAYQPMKPAHAAGTVVDAIKTNNPLFLSGKEVDFPAVKIDDWNWLKLRDVAALLAGTSKQFSVGYDAATNTITITTGGGYTPLGDELEDLLSGDFTALASSQKLVFNGQVVDVAAYNIDGYNYFRLRDLMILLDIFVGYDEATGQITLDLTKPYEE